MIGYFCTSCKQSCKSGRARRPSDNGSLATILNCDGSVELWVSLADIEKYPTVKRNAREVFFGFGDATEIL